MDFFILQRYSDKIKEMDPPFLYRGWEEDIPTNVFNIRSRPANGPDALEALMLVCRKHHKRMETYARRKKWEERR